jgi:hypothetical protein
LNVFFRAHIWHSIVSPPTAKRVATQQASSSLHAAVLVKDDITLSGPGLMRVLARTEVHGKIEKDGRGSAHLSEMSETGARAARAGRAAGNPDEKILPRILHHSARPDTMDHAKQVAHNVQCSMIKYSGSVNERPPVRNIVICGFTVPLAHW